MVDNRKIAEALFLIADYLEVLDENPFRVRAYRKAGDTIIAHPRPISSMSESELLNLPGIGKDLAGKIREFIATGKIDQLEKLKKEVPAGLLEMKKIPGLGPKKISMFYRELGIDSVESLKKAIEDGKLANIPGMKTKTIENILKGIDFYRSSRERIPLGEAFLIAEDIKEHIYTSGLAKRIEFAGSLRRMKETVGDVDILAVSDRGDELIRHFVNYPGVTEVLAAGDTKGSVRVGDELQVDLRVVPENCFGSALNYFTGSKSHNVRLRQVAREKGLKLSEYGIFKLSSGEMIAGKEEEEIYSSLGMDYIPPELREDAGEVEAAMEKRLPQLVTIKDIMGELHLHTNWSDGFHTLEEVVEIMREYGFKYLAVTDHSRSLRIAGGLSEKEVLEQKELIDRLNSKIRGITILSGIEVDILKEGKLDLPVKVLSQLDFVTGSIHSGFQMSREKATERIIRAMESGVVDMVGHLSGRLFGERSGYEVDLEKIIEKAKELDVILELNSHPKRLDIPDVACKMAKDAGVKVAITTDMHHRDDLKNLFFGIGTARRGWLEPEDVVNTWDVERVIEFVKNRRR